MPRGSRCQLVALQQHDVGPVPLGKVIRNAATDNTSAKIDTSLGIKSWRGVDVGA